MAALIFNASLALYQTHAPNDTQAQNTVLALMLEVEKKYLENDCGLKGTQLASLSSDTYRKNRQKLASYRQTVRKQIDQKLPPAQILEGFSKNIAQFLEGLVQQYIQLKPPPLCKYAFLGLGSLARLEMSPYSDLEFAILIDTGNDQNLQYFRGLVKWLEIQVIHLGETQIKILQGGYHSPVVRGFAFDDGGNTPLGKEGYIELINTPEKLAQLQSEKYYNEDEVLVNVLKGANILFGDPALFRAYVDKMRTILRGPSSIDSSLKIHQQRALHMLNGHLIEFAPRIDKKKEITPCFNIKAELYRLPSFLIAGLADYFDVEGNSTWSKIDAMHPKIFGKEGCENLKAILSAILRLRIRSHLHYEQENDEAFHVSLAKQEAIDPSMQGAFVLDDNDVNEIAKIYQTILPLHRVFKETCKSNNFTSLATQTFQDPPLMAQAEAKLKLNRFADAQSALQQALALNPDDPEKRLGFAEILLKAAKYKEAGDYLQKLVMQARTKKEEDFLSRVLLVYAKLLKREMLAKAIESLKEALEIRKRIHGDQHASVAEIFHELGEAADALDKANEAVFYYEKALEIRRKIFGPASVEVAEVLHAMSYPLSLLEKNDQVITSLREALNILKKTLSPEHPMLAEVMASLGMALLSIKANIQLLTYSKGKMVPMDNNEQVYKEALELNEAALKIYMKAYGPEHPTIARSFSNLAAVFRRQGNFEKALYYYQQALTLYKKVEGENKQIVADTLDRLGQTYVDMKKTEQAIEYYQQAQAIYRKGDYKRTRLDIKMITHMAEAWLAAKKHKKAIACYEEVIKQLQSLPRPDHRIILQMMIDIAQVWLQSGSKKKAKEALNNAATYGISNFGNNDAMVNDIYNALEDLD